MAISSNSTKILIIILIASFFNGLSWAALIPLWHTPDEQAHFAQAQNIAVGVHPTVGSSTSKDIVFSEKQLQTHRDNRGNNKFTYHPEYKIFYTSTTFGLYEREIEQLSPQLRKEFVLQEATGYPPLYYGYIAIINKIFWSGGLITRVFLSRIATVILGLCTTVTTYWLARRVFHLEFYALIATALVSFHPMWKFVGSGVTSDALMNLLYPLTLLLFLNAYEHATNKNIIFAFGVFLLAMMTKTQSILLLGWIIPIVIPILFKRNQSISPALKFLLLTGVSIILFSVTVNILATFFPMLVNPLTKNIAIFKGSGIPDIALFRSNHPTLAEYIRSVGVELYKQTLPWYFGVYRWLSLTLPIIVYRMIKGILVVSFAGWIIGLCRRRVTKLLSSSIIVLFVSSVMYAGGILAWNFLYWQSHGFPLGIQGRYFFPNLPEHMILILAGLLFIVPLALRKVVATISAILMIIFNWYSLWFVASSYYEPSNIKTFFLQASQYKPWFFKTPILPVFMVLTAGASVSLCYLLLYYMKNEGKS